MCIRGRAFSYMVSTPQNKRKTVAELLAALKQCGKTGDLQAGKAVHVDAVEAKCQSNTYVVAALITMYSKCRSMFHARDVFDNMKERNVVVWTSLILGYVENGESMAALDVFIRMDCEPDSYTFVAALKACTGLATHKQNRKLCIARGRLIHKQVTQLGVDTITFLVNSLLGMYSKCGSMQHAHSVFDTTVSLDVVTWNNLILGYVENGESLVALDLFMGMDCEPDCITFVAALKACADLETQMRLEGVLIVHKRAKERGYDTDVLVANTLVDTYRKCRSMYHARAVFDRMLYRDVISWTTLMKGYVEDGEGLLAMELYRSMDCEPNSVTVVAALKACASLASEKIVDREFCLEKGIAIHRQAQERGFGTDIFVVNTLLDMYRKCGSMLHTRNVFNQMRCRDVVSWTSLIHGYVENGESLAALELFMNIDCEPDSVTYVAALKACSSLVSERQTDRQVYIEKGIAIHKQAKERGFDKDILVASNLVDMYMKFGSTSHARAVFDNMVHRDVVSWNSLMLGYVENGESLLAMDLFKSMDCVPDSVSFVAALKACIGMGVEKHVDVETCLSYGVHIHTEAWELGCEDMFVLNTLLDMYIKCREIHKASDIFRIMKHRDVISWNTLMMGYVDNGESSVAVDLFNSMECEPDCVSFVVVVKAYGSLAALEDGRAIHTHICRLGLDNSQEVATSLVEFYGKCGCSHHAEEVFNRVYHTDTMCFNALIAGHSSLGNTQRVFVLMYDMSEACVEHDGVTFLLALAACSHAGTVEEGVRCFRSMSRYDIRPSVEHYTCLIDMLGRANRLQDAFSIINTMPFQADAVAWRSLLGACWDSKNSQGIVHI